MQRYVVTALESVDLTIDPGDDRAPVRITLQKGEEESVRRVVRVAPQEGQPPTDIVPHPSDMWQSVRVSGLIELLRVK